MFSYFAFIVCLVTAMITKNFEVFGIMAVLFYVGGNILMAADTIANKIENTNINKKKEDQGSTKVFTGQWISDNHEYDIPDSQYTTYSTNVHDERK